MIRARPVVNPEVGNHAPSRAVLRSLPGLGVEIDAHFADDLDIVGLGFTSPRIYAYSYRGGVPIHPTLSGNRDQASGAAIDVL